WCVLSVLFFFSSRRRHTRSKRDWSSDVCSSDLQIAGPFKLLIDHIIHPGTRLNQSRGQNGQAPPFFQISGRPEESFRPVKGGREIGRASCRERAWVGESAGCGGSTTRTAETEGD